jgi:Tfp pilus assembly protein PilN
MMIPILHDVKAGFLLAVGLAMLVLICAVAGLGTIMRPAPWADRRASR